MDPVIAVLLQAAGVFGTTMLNETAKRTVGEAFDRALKALRRRLGNDHPAPVLAEQLRGAAQVEAQAAPLRDQLSQIRLASDPELLAAVQPLAMALNGQGLQLPAVYAHQIQGAGVVMGNQTNNFN